MRIERSSVRARHTAAHPHVRAPAAEVLVRTLQTRRAQEIQSLAQFSLVAPFVLTSRAITRQ